jgi:hypothetical protein
MAHFLRDQIVTNLSISEDKLTQISSVFSERAMMLNTSVPENDTTGKKAIFSCIIRFDNKGYRVFTVEDLIRYFHQAKVVERVIFTIETGESLRSNRQIGSILELRLDEKEMNTCFLTATSDDKDWVDASFSVVQDVLAKCRNRNGWARSTWTYFGVQIVGVTLGFILSVWAATKIAPLLAIENSFIFSFLFALLIFSNTWMFLSQQVIRLINTAFPNIKFYRPNKEHLHWIFQAVIGGAVAAVVLYVLGQAASFLLDILSALVRK